jgi:hypothetical protein
MKDPHAPNELAIFSGFVSASGLPVADGSVVKRPPPEPDILCEVAGDGLVAFELLELLDQDRVARTRGIQDEVEGGFRDGFWAMPEAERDRMVKKLGNATVRVLMNPKVSSSRRRAAVGPVLRVLLDVNERFEGEYPLPGKLGDLAKVTIVRGNFSGPRFKSITAAAYDPIPAGGWPGSSRSPTKAARRSNCWPTLRASTRRH